MESHPRCVQGAEFILSHHVGASLVAISLAGDAGQEHCVTFRESLGTLEGHKACCASSNPSPHSECEYRASQGSSLSRVGPGRTLGSEVGSFSLCWMDDLNERMESAWDRIQGKGKKRMKVMKTLTGSAVDTSICSRTAQPVFKKMDVF